MLRLVAFFLAGCCHHYRHHPHQITSGHQKRKENKKKTSSHCRCSQPLLVCVAKMPLLPSRSLCLYSVPLPPRRRLEEEGRSPFWLPKGGRFGRNEKGSVMSFAEGDTKALGAASKKKKKKNAPRPSLPPFCLYLR